ncbi:UbiA prenyltransferase family protein [Halocatena pleomorpha]|uniref:Decaprenyl-phosphate phosphoribosyltransferase n=1 Tax=Halocatena pleomorpha TaxID=1785090 RepID=A0A3P3R887_9EURY|nr:UbiA prenyltransferase family protein [Halocatena pleomorpha]RRJ28860.1 decaprenyl-phosphate phosphoribosyltransferase [Halocatena pleomorpha]
MSNRSITSQSANTIRGLLRELRPHQWYKQSVLLLGLLFSRNLFSIPAWWSVLSAVVAFTAVAGAVYVINDICDREEDRNHPEKRHRPIASGQLSVPVAGTFAVGLLVGGLLVGYIINGLVLLVLIGYLGQNIVYSVFLKEVVLVDVLTVGIGFVLRAAAGVVAIGVYLSPWLILCTFLLALVLAVGKRRHELETVSNPDSTRESLRMYTDEELDQLLVVTMAVLLMTYALYTFFHAETPMMFALPFVFYGVFRYHHLTHTTAVAGRPEYLLTDRPMFVTLLVWLLITVGVLYQIPVYIMGLL